MKDVNEASVESVVIQHGQPLGRLDDNGIELKNGDRVRVTKSVSGPITDGFGRGDNGTWKGVDSYEGVIYYDSSRCEFRIDDQRFGDRQRSRNFYEFDSIRIVSG